MRKLILILSMVSTSFCGLGDEYRALTEPGYVKYKSTQENLKDVAVAFTAAGALSLARYFCTTSGEPCLNDFWLGFKWFALGCAVMTNAFSDEIHGVINVWIFISPF